MHPGTIRLVGIIAPAWMLEVVDLVEGGRHRSSDIGIPDGAHLSAELHPCGQGSCETSSAAVDEGAACSVERIGNGFADK